MPSLTLPGGGDIIKGGKFFGSSLTPNGSFSNTPTNIVTREQNSLVTPTITLTLEKIKENLK